MSSFCRYVIALGTLLSPMAAAPPAVLSGPPGPVRVGNRVTVTFSLPASAASDTVTFSVDGAFAGAATLARGQATFTTGSLATGAHRVDATAAGATASLPVTVTPLRPAGGFDKSATFPASTRAIAADFNNDGKTDLAIGHKVFLGNGDGTFTAAPDLPADARATADFNRDGYADLVSADAILLGNGDGTFRSIPFDASAAANILTGDFNADGIPDIAATYPSGELRVSLGRPSLSGQDPTFQSRSLARPDAALKATAVGATLAMIETDSVVLVRLDPAGAFATSSLAVPGATDLAIGDLNADGVADLAVTAEARLHILSGQPDGTFVPAATYPVGGAHHPLLADLNGDGIPDVVIGAEVLYGNSDGTLQKAVTLPLPAATQALAAADFNADGRVDIVVSGDEGGALLIAYASPLTISLASCATSAAVGSLYFCSAIASGGTPPYNIDCTGAPGLTAGQAGLSGTLSSGGSFRIGCNVTDNAHPPNSTNTSIMLTVSKAPVVISLVIHGLGGFVGDSVYVSADSDGPTVNGTPPPQPTVTVSPVSVCSYSSGSVRFSGPGNCTVNAVTPSTPVYTPASATQTITVTGPLTLTATILPQGTVGVPYSAQLTGGGGSPPYRFSSATQDGVSLSNSGAFSGTPTSAGVYPLSIIVSDTGTGLSNSPLVLTVNKKPQTINFHPPQGIQVGTSITLNGSADSGLPVSYSVRGACSVSGAQVNSTAADLCIITATQMGDATYAAAQSVTVTLNSIQFAVSPASLSFVQGGSVTPASQPVKAVSHAAVFESFSTASSWLTVTSSGDTATVSINRGLSAGTYSGSVTATAAGISVNIPVSLTVTPALAPYSITISGQTQVLTAGSTTTLTSSVPNVTWSSATPFDCTVSSSGVVTAVARGDCDIIASKAADNAHLAGSASYFISVPPAVQISTGTLPAATVGLPYSAVLVATGGSGTGYTWSAGAALPPGLSLSPAGVISGSPSSAGPFSLNVTATDNRFVQVFQSKSLTLTVNPAGNATLSLSSTAVGLTAAAGGSTASQPVTMTLSAPGSPTAPWTVSSSAPWLTASPASGNLAGGTATVILTANPAQLAAGTQNATVSVAAGGISGSVQVTLTVTTQPFTLSPASLAFSFVAGGTAPSAQNVVVTSQPGGAPLSAFGTTANGGPWLAVSSAASTPGTISVSVSQSVAALLPAGTYTGTITVTSGSSTAGSVSVTLTVSAVTVIPNTFTVSPAALSFNAPAGGAAVSQPLTLTLSTSSTTPPAWSVSPGPSWLSLSPDSGIMTAVGPVSGGLTTYTASLTATGSPALLTAGIQPVGTVVFSAAGSQVSLTASLNVVQAAQFTAAPATLSFSYTAGSSALPAAQSVAIGSQPSALAFSASAITTNGGNWLVASASATSTPSGLTVSIAPDVLATLTPGTYSGTITLSGSGAPGIMVPVSLMVSAPAGSPSPSTAMLSASPASLSLSATPFSGAVSQSVTLTFASSSPTAPAWSSSPSAGWISASPASGTMTPTGASGGITTYSATITVSGDPSRLATGKTSGVMNFTIAGNSTAVAVSLTLSRPQGFDILYNNYVFTWRTGDPIPGPQGGTVTTNPSGAAFTVTGNTTSGGNWLSVATVSPTPGSFSVSINPAVLPTLAPGSYVGSVNVLGVIIPVTLAVTSTAGPKINPGGVVPVYNTRPTIQPGSWISIYGDQLAPSTAVWNGDFPTSLNGVTVNINGKPGYIWFVSPGQINLQAPDDMTLGPVTVEVITPSGTTVASVGLSPESPSFSLLDAKQHIAAFTVNPDGSLEIVGPYAGFDFPTRPVSAGDTLILYGVGFGPTATPVAAGGPVGTPAVATIPLTLTIGGQTAQVTYLGVVGAGLYQINCIVPGGLAAGDQPVRGMLGEFPTGNGPVITIQ